MEDRSSRGRQLSRRTALGLLGAVPLAGALAPSRTARAASPLIGRAPAGELDRRIQEIIRRPEFQGARWGAQFYAPDTGESIYSLNTDQLFNAGSSHKVFVAGTAFTAFGHDHRFRTRVYRTGPIRGRVLKGDLVLVAGGDVLLSGRIRPGGELALPTPDHSYHASPGAGPIGGDPLREIRLLARQVAASGVRRVEGRVLVDASLFREGKEKMASNPDPVTVSPMMVNDNMVDVTVGPGRRSGDPAVLEMTPKTDYVRIVNKVRTIPADQAADARPLAFEGDVRNPDGTHTVNLVGDIPVGSDGLFRAYFVPEPPGYAQRLFAQTLRDAGVDADADASATPAITELTQHYTTGNLVAEHVSPPLPEEMKVMLKVSSNLHTVTWPYRTGGIAAKDQDDPKAAGERLQGELFTKAGLPAQPPGSEENLWTSQFFVEFLAYMGRQPHFREYRQALPILGRDGSLADVQPNSPAAGHVYAKTGTGKGTDGDGVSSIHKALAGYVELPNGRMLTFGTFMEQQVASASELEEAAARAGQALGEIAAAAYTTRHM